MKFRLEIAFYILLGLLLSVAAWAVGGDKAQVQLAIFSSFLFGFTLVVWLWRSRN